VLTDDNANEFMFGFDQVPYAADPDIEPALRWQRFVAPFWGILTVTLAYVGARMILSRQWALFAAVIFAFNPVTTYLFSYLTNDAPSIFFGTAATVGIVYLLRRKMTIRTLFLTGLMIGLGLLTKASVLVFVPVAGLAVMIRVWNDSRRTRTSASLQNLIVPVIRNGLILALPIVVIGGAWYGWRLVRYGDPFGFATHTDTVWALEEPRPFDQALVRAFDANAFPIRSMWYGVSSAIAMPGDWALIAPYGLLLLAGIGYARRFREIISRRGGVVLCVFLVCLAMFTAYVRWLMEFIFLTGRLMLPGYLAYVLLLTTGIAYGWQGIGARAIRLIFAALVLFIGTVIVGGITFPRAFIANTFPANQLPTLSGTSLRFGDAELVGYQIEQAHLDGHPLDVTLCWRSLREDERLPVPYAFGFNIVDEHNTIYAGKESYPGLGKYTLWYPGRAFCDRFKLPMEREIIPARGYRLSVGLFDPVTLAPVPADDNASPFVGWIAAPGPTLTSAELAAAAYSFSGVYLLDYTIETTTDTVQLSTAWGTGEWQPRPLTLFIHVVDDDDTIVAQLDQPLGGETYPSHLWGDDERTFSGEYRLNLPADFTGQYQVYMGLYDSETLARIEVTDKDGIVQADGRLRVGIFEE
jgi:hypothetical protein